MNTQRNRRRLVIGGIATAILVVLGAIFWFNPEAPAQRDKITATAEHTPSATASERQEEPREEEPRGSTIDEPLDAPLMSNLKDLSTIPDKDSKVAKAAEPCSVISGAEIEKIFKNREVTFYHEDVNTRRSVPNNPQLIRPCDYTGIMIDTYGNRAYMTFTVFTELDNAKHEAWHNMTKGMSDFLIDDNIIDFGLGNISGHKGQVIVSIMPTSTQPGITDGDVKSLIEFALARLP